MQKLLCRTDLSDDNLWLSRLFRAGDHRFGLPDIHKVRDNQTRLQPCIVLYNKSGCPIICVFIFDWIA
jgi:hypothetical protein